MTREYDAHASLAQAAAADRARRTAQQRHSDPLARIRQVERAHASGFRMGLFIGVTLGAILGATVTIAVQARDNGPCSRYATHSIAWERCVQERDPCPNRSSRIR